MSWDQETFLARLKQAVDSYDGEAAAALCQELVDGLAAGAELQPGLGREALALLRRKRYFELMERVAGALHAAEADDAQVRRQYAQALIDQGIMLATSCVLELLVERTAGTDPDEVAEARGLLGRIDKQHYANAARIDPRSAPRHAGRFLRRALTAYGEVYRSAPERYLWQGINVAALAHRAAADGVDVPDRPDGRGIARDVLAVLRARHAALAEGKTLEAWDLATAMEACLALGDIDQAWTWLGHYVRDEDADAFELASTERQLCEIWGLTVAEPPGALLLPVLQSAALLRRFGRVELAATQVRQTIGETFRAEKTFGTERYVPLAWYRTGLERCGGVAQIKDGFGRGLGTGFLLRGDDLAPSLGEGAFLLTNHHVVPKAVAWDDAVISFEALAGQTFRVVKELWTSPFVDLDATLLQLDRPVPGADVYPIARDLPAPGDTAKVYVIGHPLGGGLSLSLTDNALLGTSERLLHYRAPTEGGSSGSPVFDDKWRLIGLHHGGGVGLKRLDGLPGRYDANEGISIHRILEAVRAAAPAPAAERRA